MSKATISHTDKGGTERVSGDSRDTEKLVEELFDKVSDKKGSDSGSNSGGFCNEQSIQDRDVFYK